MNTVGETEGRTQERVITFFQKTLGWTYLGNWQARQDNSNVEKDLLTDWLKSRKHDDEIIAKVLHELNKASALGSNRSLIDTNRTVYELLRYGVNVQPNTGKHRITVARVISEAFSDEDLHAAVPSICLCSFFLLIKNIPTAATNPRTVPHTPN